jgi:hypothetical protein
MSHVRCLLLIAALSFLPPGTASRAQEEQQQVLPARDVDITYQITRPDQPPITERRRWLASEHLERVDGPDKSITIFDRNAGDFTLLNPSNHTYRKLEGAPRQAGEKDPASKRDGVSVVAGLRCVDLDGRHRKAHRMLDTRRRAAAPCRRWSDCDASKLGDLPKTAGRAFPGSAEL